MKKNKMIILIIVIVIILLLGGFLLVRGSDNKKHEEMNDLKISYSEGKVISFNKFDNSFKEERTITVENNSDENRTYSLEWVKVNNTLKNQSNFTYDIKCSGDRCATLEKSQVPVAGSKVYTQVLIEPNKKQEYIVTFNYSGSEKDVKFKGTLQVYSEKIDKKALEEEEKELEQMEDELEEETKSFEA